MNGMVFRRHAQNTAARDRMEGQFVMTGG